MNLTATHEDPDVKAEMAAYMREIERQRVQILEDRVAGVKALQRLLPIAQRDTGQSARVARLLLGCYNGSRFPFDLTNLRSLDYSLLEDCLAVLRMDANLYQEVHQYFPNGSQVFEKLAADWGFEKQGRAG